MDKLVDGGPADDGSVNFTCEDYVGDEEDLLEAEVKAVVDEKGVPRDQIFGVAFSGGGIRSGVFCLGVMQKLAAAGIFKHVDYLSTVSGGGYIGSALAWWLSGKSSRKSGNDDVSFDVGKNLPWGTSDPNKIDKVDNEVLTHLRKNGNYLIPGNGITLLSGIGVVLRAVLLNLLVWIPIISAVFLGMLWVSVKFSELSVVDEIVAFGSAPQFVSLFKWCLFAALVIGLIYLALSVQFSLLSWSRRKVDSAEKEFQILGNAENPGDGPTGVSNTLAVLVWLLIAFVIVSAGSLISSIVGVPPRLLQGLPVISGYLEYLHQNLAVSVSCLAVFSIVSLLTSMKGSPMQNQSVIALGGLVVVLTIFQLWVGYPGGSAGTIQFSQWAPPFVLVMVSAMLVNYRLGRVFRKLRRVPSVSTRYSGRRSFEKWAGISLAIAGALIAVGMIPLVHYYVHKEIGDAGGGITGLLGVLGGVLSAYWGFYRSQGKDGGGALTGPILKFGAAALLFGLAILSFDVAVRVADSAGLFGSGHQFIPKQTATSVFTQDEVNKITQVVFLVSLTIALITGWFTNLNYISLGRFYRDRLVEAFMPDKETTEEELPDAAGLADKLKLSEVWRANRSGPYPLINANVVLANAEKRKNRLRGGSSFLLSPFMCGSDATGWQKTELFDDNEMTLATAMAISGAAANPRAGVGGKGITRSKTVSLVMNLLNFRLGYWVNNPKERNSKVKYFRPNHFFPSGFYAVTGRGYGENSKFSELSDGGHFENLGLYELVRRRCRLIIVCDGGQDNSASYSDFVTAIRRIEEDFDAKISFKRDKGPEKMIAKPKEGVYPSDALYADKGYFVAKIEYAKQENAVKSSDNPWAHKGLIIYLKTTMIDSLSMKAKGYKGANPNFPDQSTGDQFFDDEQFEAYRELGYRIAEQTIDELELETDFENGRPKFDITWKTKVLNLSVGLKKQDEPPIKATNDVPEQTAEVPNPAPAD